MSTLTTNVPKTETPSEILARGEACLEVSTEHDDLELVKREAESVADLKTATQSEIEQALSLWGRAIHKMATKKPYDRKAWELARDCYKGLLESHEPLWGEAKKGFDDCTLGLRHCERELERCARVLKQTGLLRE